MKSAAPSFNQIRAKIAAVRRKKHHRDRIIGIHSTGRWDDKSRWSEPDGEIVISQCDSPLAFRMALRESHPDDVTRVLITPLKDQDLSDDILLRIAKRRLLEIDAWEIVQSLFDAYAIDPRLTASPWIAEILLEAVPRQGFPPARGGFLDADTVWPLLLNHVLGLSAAVPDLPALLTWSLNPQHVEAFRGASKDFRRTASAWLSEKSGQVTGRILDLLMSPSGTDLIPIGLAAAVLNHPRAAGQLEKASGIFETKYLGGCTLPVADLQRWSDVATTVVRQLQLPQAREYKKLIDRADQVLADTGAAAFAHLVDTTESGFTQRLASFGKELSQLLKADQYQDLQPLENWKRSIQQHDFARTETKRLSRVEMAARLVRWLHLQVRQPAHHKSLAEAAEYHLQTGGFVDWARRSLCSGDNVQELSRAYSALFDRVTVEREQQSAKFARLLADWTEAGSKGDEILPMERILDTILQPLAKKGLVLAIVLDGMSAAVARELISDLTRQEWTEIAEPDHQHTRPGLATVPSVTEFSRTSLLSGRLLKGDQALERKQFEQHSGLLSHCRAGYPPVLFHKAALMQADDSGLPANIRKEIDSPHRRVVGVVINAIDDQLTKGEQLDTDWARDTIKLLPALLHDARVARRLVVLLSDHGHVLDNNTTGRTFQDQDAGGERWRPAHGTPDEGEILINGKRIPIPGNKLIALTSERIRYGGKKNGYHGGVTPMEMVVPVTVLSSTDDLPPGWTEKPADTPAWWDLSVPLQPSSAAPVPQLKPPVPQPAPAGMLFAVHEEQPQLAAELEIPEWVTRFLSCATFAEQKRFGGRGVPGDELFARLLTHLDNRGGKMTSTALGVALKFPPVRLPGLLSKAERVLNVEGFDVLRRDEASDTIELNRDLLLTQFDLLQ